MAWRAGEIITAARLSQKSDSAKLDDYTIEEKNEWENWTDEELTFDDPGVSVSVKAWLMGIGTKDQEGTKNSSLLRIRIAISFDGGSNWEDGPYVGQLVAGDSGEVQVMSSAYLYSGKPDGDVKIKAQVYANSDTEIEFRKGHLMAEMIPE